MPWHHDPNKLLTKLFVEHSSFILNMQKIGLFVFPVLLNVRFWHKVDVHIRTKIPTLGRAKFNSRRKRFVG